MAPFVAPGICRYTINMTIAGAAASVIMDADINDPTIGTSRDDVILGRARSMLNSWADNVMPLIADDVVFRSVSWVDLNAFDGYTGEITSTDDTELPVAGGVATDPSSSQVAVLITKRIESRRRNMRDGRTYVPGVVESWTAAGAPNTLNGTVITAFDDAMAQFLDDVNTGGGVETDVDLVVVHTHKEVDPETGEVTIEFTGKSNIGSFDTQSIVATQRRRLKRAV